MGATVFGGAELRAPRPPIHPFPLREDLGALWESYLVVERHKGLDMAGRHVNRRFWRTHDRQEIDLVEEEGGRLSG